MKYLGLDWASEIHLVALVDQQGRLLDEWEIEHTRTATIGLLSRLEREGGPGGVRIAIESGAPLLVDLLVEAGYAVFEINPKQADRFRDRHSPAGCKDDRRDAYVLADALRTDAAWLTPVVPDRPETQELRQRSRARERLVEHRVRTGLQLRETLRRYYPALLELGRKMHDAFLLSLLEAYPTPAQARRGRAERIDKLLRTHRIRSLDGDALQSLLKAPAFVVPEPVEAACREEAEHLVAQIRLLNTQIEEAEERLDALLDRHADRDLVRSLPGMGQRLAADVLAELGDDPRRRTEPEVLTVYSGTAPVTRASGTRRKPRKNGQRASVSVRMRYGCNRRLQKLLWLAARASLARSAWARAFVDQRKKAGLPYNATLRALAGKWAKILAHLLATRTLYDEGLHIDHLVANDVPWARKLQPAHSGQVDAA
jgi:transposase